MSTISASVRLTERNDAETRQLRQSAADALQSYSVLALHSLADNEVSCVINPPLPANVLIC
jgi:hypothetical protein